MDIQEFIDFMERHRPGFSTRIKPSLEYQIDDLLEDAQQPLPWLYLQYIHTMGWKPADFQLPNCTLDPIDLYYDHADRAEPYPRDRFTLMGVHLPRGHEVHMNLYFDYAKLTLGEPAIVQFETVGETEIPEDTLFVMADSFHELLLSWSSEIVYFEHRRCLHSMQYLRWKEVDRRKIDLDAQCRDFVASLGFAPPLPPTGRCWLGERGDTAVRISRLYRQEFATFFVDIAADEREEVLSTRRELEAKFGPPDEAVDLSRRPPRS